MRKFKLRGVDNSELKCAKDYYDSLKTFLSSVFFSVPNIHYVSIILHNIPQSLETVSDLLGNMLSMEALKKLAVTLIPSRCKEGDDLIDF